MTLRKTKPQHDYYTLIPFYRDQDNVVLPFYHPRNPKCRPVITIATIILVSLILVATAIYAFWPSDPTLKIVRLRLNKVHVHTFPILDIDISLNLTVRVRNVDLYTMDFKSLDVAVMYRGKKLGHVKSGQGHVRALASSYVDAELELNGVLIMSDVVSLLEDLARGTVPFDTVSQVTGNLGFLFFRYPLKAKMTCDVLVNTNNQTIVRQKCYPER